MRAPVRILDLSMPIIGGRTLYPDELPARVTVTHTRQRDGYLLERLDISSHEGTHIDAPIHMLEGGESLDQLPLGGFVAPAVVFDLRGIAPGTGIGSADLQASGRAPREGEIAILFTGWGALPISERWVYDAPWLTDEGAQGLADAGVSGIGIDHISLSTMTAEHDWAPHKLLARRSIWGLEGLIIPDELTDPGPWLIVALPLSLVGASGAPARVVAIELAR